MKKTLFFGLLVLCALYSVSAQTNPQNKDSVIWKKLCEQGTLSASSTSTIFENTTYRVVILDVVTPTYRGYVLSAQKHRSDGNDACIYCYPLGKDVKESLFQTDHDTHYFSWKNERNEESIVRLQLQ